MENKEFKPPKTRTSNNVCPHCGDRGTKMYSMSTGLFTCQTCEGEYEWDIRLKR